MVKAAGGNRAVAEKLGVDSVTIWRWSKADQFHERHVKTLCEMADWLFTPIQVRPDLPELFGDK